MNEEIREFICHHGTTSKNAKCIKEKGFTISPAGWLGKGVYFFQNNPDLARAWAKKRFKDQRVEVITRSIKVKNEKVFDMVDTDGEHNKLFHKLRSDLLTQSKKNGIMVNLDKEKFEKQIRDIETKIINNICDKGKFEVIRATTFTRFFGIDEWSVTPNGTEICVRNFSYIA